MLFLVTACEKEKESPRSLDANPRTLEFAATHADAQVVNVEARNVKWGVEFNDASVDWLHLTKTDEETITVSVDDNTTRQMREAKFTIKSNAGQVAPVEITVKQDVARSILSVDTSNLVFWTYEKPQTVTVTAQNVEWDVEVAGNLTWLHIEKSDDGVVVSVDQYESTSPREGRFTITSDVEEVPDIEITVTQNEQHDVAVFAQGAYRQDYYENGLSNFMFTLYTYPMDEDHTYPTGAGYELTFDGFSESPASEFYPDLAPGTYVVEDTNKAFTILPGDGTPYGGAYFDYSVVIYTDDTGRRFDFDGVRSGTVTVERDGDNYTIVADLILTDGTPLKTYYSGRMPISNPFMTSFAEDTEITGITGGRANYYGNYYHSGGTINDIDAYYWFIELWGDGLEFDGSTMVVGTGDYFRLELYSPKEGDGTRIPAGEYELVPDAQETKAAYKAVPAYVGFAAAGCWYMYLEDSYVKNTLAPLLTNFVRISHNGTKHIIEIDAEDDAGNRITSRYEGDLQILDYSEDANASASIPTMKYRPAVK